MRVGRRVRIGRIKILETRGRGFTPFFQKRLFRKRLFPTWLQTWRRYIVSVHSREASRAKRAFWRKKSAWWRTRIRQDTMHKQSGSSRNFELRAPFEKIPTVFLSTANIEKKKKQFLSNVGFLLVKIIQFLSSGHHLTKYWRCFFDNVYWKEKWEFHLGPRSRA